MNQRLPQPGRATAAGADARALTVQVDPHLFALLWQENPRIQRTGLPAFGRLRDLVLRATPQIENMWASAVAKAVTKEAAIGFDIDDSAGRPRVGENARSMLLWFDGAWTDGISKHLQDFLLTNNGAFIEVERESKTPWSRAVALWHLDSLYCRRTGLRDYPVVYADRDGHEHQLRYDQVLCLVDMPSPSRTMLGSGQCAADRAWETILKLYAVETYFREMITGGGRLEIHIVNGISDGQLDDALNHADEKSRAKGFVVYRGSTVIPTMKMDTPPSVITIPLAKIPAGFDVEVALRDAYLRYANALGVPVQDVQPLSGQGLGTGTQTTILAEEAEGYGRAAWRRKLLHAFNQIVLPRGLTFGWSNSNDIPEQQRRATMLATKSKVATDLVGAGVLTVDEARAWLADERVIARTLVPDDPTPGEVFADDESNQVEAEAEPPIVEVVKAALYEPTDAPGERIPAATIRQLVSAAEPRATALATEALNGRS